MESVRRGWLAAAATGAVLLGAPATASAASVAVFPRKACYRSAAVPNGEKVFVGGTGFTPGAPAEVTLDRKSLGLTQVANPQGQVAGVLSLGAVSRERNRLLALTDQANPANFGTLALHASAVAVRVSPRRAGPGRSVRIKASGFTGTRRLYAHIRRGHHHRNVRIGRLRGACGKLSRRNRVFSGATRPGVYRVQFDGSRRYSSRTAPRILYRVTVFRRRSASAAAAAWVRLL